jgi:hypothetical protein
MQQVSFAVTDAERQTINQISARVCKVLKASAVKLPKGFRLHVQMDLAATHANGCPLRFDDLLKADDFNLLHDVLGIDRHLDRATGQLTGFFSPRFSAPVSQRCETAFPISSHAGIDPLACSSSAHAG